MTRRNIAHREFPARPRTICGDDRRFARALDDLPVSPPLDWRPCPSRAPYMAKLIVRRDGTPQHECELQATNSIGRLQHCTVQLEDPQISRVHALITQGPDGYVLADQGSMNGTYLNGTRLGRGEEVVLKDGDALRIQDFDLSFALEGAAPSAPVDLDASQAAIAELEAPPEASILLSHLLDERERVPVWSKGEIVLKVADIINETEHAKTYRLVGKTDTLFSYKPGQFVTISLDIDGKTVKRSYSISSSPSRPHTLELTIKRVPGGLVSNWMADRIALGDEIAVRGPAGKFSCFNYPSRKILCLAGGSGITPIMSMLRWIVDTTADVDVILLLSGHNPSDFIFRKELETISARHSGLRVLFTVTTGWTGTEAWTGLTGRVSRQMIELVAPDILERHVFMCGPKPFGEAMKAELKDLEFPMANMHTESFGEGRVAKGTPPTPDAAPAPPPVAAPSTATDAPAAVSAVVAETPSPVAAEPAQAPITGHHVKFSVSSAECTATPDGCLLELAEAHDVEIDYACRSGSCGSCRTKCVSGDVRMDDCDLSDEERAEGWIYPCVAYAESDVELEA